MRNDPLATNYNSSSVKIKSWSAKITKRTRKYKKKKKTKTEIKK